MNDYYSLYTWAMDKQAHLEREATQRRLVRQLRIRQRPTARRLWPGRAAPCGPVAPRILQG